MLADRCRDVYLDSTNSTDLIRRLQAEGWQEVHVKGSHHKFKHPSRAGHVSVPHPKRDLPIGTLRSIFRQAGWDWRQE